MAHGQTTPYLPLLEILRTNFQVEEGDNPLQVQEKLRQGVHLLDPSLERTLPFLEALFGLPGADNALRHLEPKDKRQQTFEAIRTLAIAGSQRRPHVLVCENLHWLDQTSEDCLAMLIESLAGFPILVLTTHRPGYAVRWADKTYYTQITPDLLTDAEARQWWRRCLEAAPSPAAPAVHPGEGGHCSKDSGSYVSPACLV